MLYLVSGNVGSGKTLQQIKVICDKLLTGRNVISNIDFKYEFFVEYFSKLKKYEKTVFGKYIYRPYLEPEFLFRYALRYHDLSPEAPENQTLIIMDESSEYFNNREWQTRKDRKSWITFIEQHRKLKFTVVLVIQDWEDIDIKVQRKAEYIEEHKKVNNIGGPTFLLNMFKINLFITLTRWNATTEKKIVKKEYFQFKPFYSKLYNTNQLLNDFHTMYLEFINEPFEIEEVEVQTQVQKRIKERLEVKKLGIGECYIKCS